MEIFRPRASRMAPRDAAAMPFPNEETTPPVTNTKRVMGILPPGLRMHRMPRGTGDDGPTGYQISGATATRSVRDGRFWDRRGCVRAATGRRWPAVRPANRAPGPAEGAARAPTRALAV